MNIRKCLMEKVTETAAYKNSDPTKCDDLERHAFDTHSDCYIEHDFCSVILKSAKNLKALWEAIELRDLFSLHSVKEVK